jgi:hypothetical protein
MPVGTPVHRVRNNGTGGSITTTVMFTPAVGSLLLVPVGRKSNVSVPTEPTISGGGLAWSLAGQSTMDVGSGQRWRYGLWKALVTEPVAAFAVTSTQIGGTPTIFMCCEIPGAAAGITNLDFDEDTAGDPVAVLGAAPAAASISMAFAVFDGTTAVAPPSGFTELNEHIAASPSIVHQSSYSMTPVDTATWSTTNGHSMGLIVEIKPAGRTRAAAVWF